MLKQAKSWTYDRGEVDGTYRKQPIATYFNCGFLSQIRKFAGARFYLQ